MQTVHSNSFNTLLPKQQLISGLQSIRLSIDKYLINYHNIFNLIKNKEKAMKIKKFFFSTFLIICNIQPSTLTQLGQKNILLIINYNHPHYESIDLLKSIYQKEFAGIVFYGPTEHNNVIKIPHKKGFFSYRCIADAMHRYPHYDGYLFLMDDCILSTWLLKNLDVSKIWFPEVLCLSGGRGTPIDINKGKNAIIWSWWQSKWGYQATKDAFKYLTQEARKNLQKNWGSDLTAIAAFSDMAYIPSMYKEKFITLSEIFGLFKVFLEIALPTIVSCLSPKEEWLWLPGTYTDRKNQTAVFYDYMYLHHPIKLSDTENQKFIQALFSKKQIETI